MVTGTAGSLCRYMGSVTEARSGCLSWFLPHECEHPEVTVELHVVGMQHGRLDPFLARFADIERPLTFAGILRVLVDPEFCAVLQGDENGMCRVVEPPGVPGVVVVLEGGDLHQAISHPASSPHCAW